MQYTKVKSLHNIVVDSIVHHFFFDEIFSQEKSDELCRLLQMIDDNQLSSKIWINYLPAIFFWALYIDCVQVVELVYSVLSQHTIQEELPKELHFTTMFELLLKRGKYFIGDNSRLFPENFCLDSNLFCTPDKSPNENCW